jgi:hypothetical protein
LRADFLYYYLTRASTTASRDTWNQSRLLSLRRSINRENKWPDILHINSQNERRRTNAIIRKQRGSGTSFSGVAGDAKKAAYDSTVVVMIANKAASGHVAADGTPAIVPPH